MDLVPVVDVAHPEATSLVALDRACADHGFFLLSGHGLDDVIADTFDAARRFFAADPGVKNAVRRDERVPLGYNDRELTKRRRDHNPPREAVIEPVAALAGTTPVYRPFAFREFITARSADNYADLGADDTQIAAYRIAG